MKVLTAPVKATVYLEGPPVGVDLLASCFSIALSNPEPVRSSVLLQYCHSFTKLYINGDPFISSRPLSLEQIEDVISH